MVKDGEEQLYGDVEDDGAFFGFHLQRSEGKLSDNKTINTTRDTLHNEIIDNVEALALLCIQMSTLVIRESTNTALIMITLIIEAVNT